MRPTVVIREYDSSTGEIMRLHDPVGFGEVLAGGTCDVRVFDFVITGVRDISDFTISITDSDGIEVSPPDAVVENNVADAGSFGIENSSLFVIKTSLTEYFAELNLPVSIPMRSDYVTNFIYFNMSPGTYEKVNGIIKYNVNFKYEDIASSSSMSSDSSSNSSSSLGAMLYYTHFLYTPVTEPLYFKRVAEECEYKSIVYNNPETYITVAEHPCDSGIWIIIDGPLILGDNHSGPLGTYSNGWIVSEA